MELVRYAKLDFHSTNATWAHFYNLKNDQKIGVSKKMAMTCSKISFKYIHFNFLVKNNLENQKLPIFGSFVKARDGW